MNETTKSFPRSICIDKGKDPANFNAFINRRSRARSVLAKINSISYYGTIVFLQDTLFISYINYYLL